MSEVNNKTEIKVEKKRLRGRNSYEVINQIVESYNKSEGWALKRVNMIGMNVEVYLERSADQAGSNVSDTKEVSNAKKSKEETAKTSEPQAESKEIVIDVDDTKSKSEVSAKTDSSVKPTAKRGRAATKK